MDARMEQGKNRHMAQTETVSLVLDPTAPTGFRGYYTSDDHDRDMPLIVSYSPDGIAWSPLVNVPPINGHAGYVRTLVGPDPAPRWQRRATRPGR